MTPENFCYWLNGHFDLNPDSPLTEQQVHIIRQHLALVFDEQSVNIDLETRGQDPLDKLCDKSPGWPTSWPFDLDKQTASPRRTVGRPIAIC